MAEKGQFVGRVDDAGKLLLYNMPGFRGLLKFLSGKQVVVTVGALKKDRSSNQNRYYWSVVVKTLGDDLGYAQDEMHEALKLKFLRMEAEPEKRRVLATVRSTARLTTDEFEDYLDRIRMWAAADMGIVIPLPNEV